MCPPMADKFNLLDCFVTLAMTKELESLSLRASASDAWQSSLFYVVRSAQNLLSARCSLKIKPP